MARIFCLEAAGRRPGAPNSALGRSLQQSMASGPSYHEARYATIHLPFRSPCRAAHGEAVSGGGARRRPASACSAACFRQVS
jgi:hypothetical protein